MKKALKFGILALTAAASIAVVSQLAIAGDKKADAKKTDDKKPGIFVLDTNKDGVITLDEMKARPNKSKQPRSPEAEQRIEERFKELDKNNDGKIDAAEIEKFKEERNKPISKKEFMSKANERAEKAFDKLDTNKDGTIDANERQSAREALRKKIEERRAELQKEQKKN